MPNPDKYRSLTYHQQRARAQSKAAGNMQPLMRKAAEAIERMTQRAIDESRSPAGQPYKALAPSTLAARGPGESSKPLDKTGVSRSQIRCFASSRNGCVLMVPRNLNFHRTALGARPKRNVTPYEKGADGKSHPIRKLDLLMRRLFRAHVVDLRAEADLPLSAE